MLRRIRIGFGLLACVLVAALGFLILRTLDTLDRERELEHAAVANRVFDEAEGALAGFLRDEQTRPASAYRDRRAGERWMDARPEFVRAYFEIDHRGDIRTSAGAPDLEAALRGTADARLAKLERKSSQRVEDAKDDQPEKKRTAPSPGTARNLQSIDLVTGRAKAGSPEAPEADDASPYSSGRALETLGRIARSTARKEAAIEIEQEMSGADPQPPIEPDAFEARAPTRAQARNPSVALEEEMLADEDMVAPRAPASLAAPVPVPARAPLPLAPSRLSGERLDDDRLVLYRTALDDAGRAVQQGMLVAIAPLGEWLTRRVLGESELRDALTLRLHSSSVEPIQDLPIDRYVFDYRFAEPFETLSLQLAIAPLDDGGNARNIAWLSALLIAASTLGLYAVYRTVAVAVHFAERRSNFAAAVSHELKTPLTAIRMYGEMLRDGMVTDEAKRQEYYSTITSESERLTRLINNVLEWSKLEKQQREANLVSADVTPAIRELVEIVAPHAAAEGFEIQLRLPETSLPVRHEPDALAQILYNLIDNAIKYARGHEPKRIEIRAEATDGGLGIRVRDHGPGVEPGKLDLVFDAFYRAEDESTRQTKGTGIGLALGRGLAESMGGRLTARNHPKGGLEVELWLPAA